ncbi:partial glucose-1-phosphate adenylyltransferase, partial [biofilm metagenome]
SMGIYIFNAQFLWDQLLEDDDNPHSSHDFGKDIIPKVIHDHVVNAYPFLDLQSGEQSYWRDVGTIDAYWKANMELIGVNPDMNLYDTSWPIWTYQEQTPPAKFVFNDEERRGNAVDSMVSGGCIISGANIINSMIFSNVKVNSYSTVKDSIVLPEVAIGRNCQITKTILEKSCIVPEGTVIGENIEEDRERYYVSEGGVVVVTPEMLGQKLHYIR